MSKVILLSKAVAEFQAAAGDDYWAEHGISDAECLKGLVATFTAAGVEFEDDLSELWAQRAEADRVAYEAREAARRARLTPEQRASEDRLKKMMQASSMTTREMMYHQILDTSFAPRVSTFTPEVGPGLLQRITFEDR